MSYSGPSITTSGATFAKLQGGGLSGVLELLIAAQTATVAPTAAPTATATGGGATGGALGAGTYYFVHTETNGIGETTVSPQGSQLTVAAGNQPQFTFPSLKAGNVGRKLYLGTVNGTTGGPYYLYASDITTTTYTAATAVGTNSYATTQPPTLNTTGLTYVDATGNTLNTPLVLLRGAKTGNLEDAYRYAAQVLRNFLSGEPVIWSGEMTKFRHAHTVFAAVAQAMSDIGTLLDANSGTLKPTVNVAGQDAQVRRTWPVIPRGSMLAQTIPGGGGPILRSLEPLRDHESTIVPRPLGPRPTDFSNYLVSVPVATYVNLNTDLCLRQLEAQGIQVDRAAGSSAIDTARNVRASKAIRDGYDSILFVDSDMMFDVDDAIKIFRRPEPVVAGMYAAKVLGTGQLNAHFMPGVDQVKLGKWCTKLYPLRRVGGGFLRIKIDFLQRMVKELKLPYCRSGGTFAWPFFQPVVIRCDGENQYLTEDYAFSWRCEQMGEPVLGDGSLRLGHVGDYVYMWEEAGGHYIPRHANVLHEILPGSTDKPEAPEGLDVVDVA